MTISEINIGHLKAQILTLLCGVKGGKVQCGCQKKQKNPTKS